MFSKALNLAFNVSYALQICPPDYVHSIVGDPDSWSTETCPHTELQLAQVREWRKGLPELAYILIPALPWNPPALSIPFSDLLFRPSVVFRYPLRANVPNPAPKEMWFFINGICTDHSVVLLNAEYLYSLFKRPLTVVHNFTRGIIPDLAACAVGKGWDQVTESAAVAFPPIYAALKETSCERLILLGHSQGTILSAVVLALLQELHPPLQKWLSAQVDVGPERTVARKLAKRWHFERTMQATPEESDAESEPDSMPTFLWPGHGRRQPEALTEEELRKLEMYCFANCASEMRSLPANHGGSHQIGPAWIESYGNEMDIVARLGVLANVKGPGSVRIAGDRYMRDAAWGHLLNAHYLHPMMTARSSKQPAGGLVALKGNQRSIPRLFGYLDAKSPPRLR
jgi:hypothetical protein